MHATNLVNLDEARERTRAPDMGLHIKGNGRAIAVAKFRELADMLESGELNGARIQWRADDGPETEMVTVTVSETTVQMLTTKIEEG